MLAGDGRRLCFSECDRTGAQDIGSNIEDDPRSRQQGGRRGQRRKIGRGRGRLVWQRRKRRRGWRGAGGELESALAAEGGGGWVNPGARRKVGTCKPALRSADCEVPPSLPAAPVCHPRKSKISQFRNLGGLRWGRAHAEKDIQVPTTLCVVHVHRKHTGWSKLNLKIMRKIRQQDLLLLSSGRCSGRCTMLPVCD